MMAILKGLGKYSHTFFTSILKSFLSQKCLNYISVLKKAWEGILQTFYSKL